MKNGPSTKELNSDTTPAQVLLLATKYRNCKIAQSLLWAGTPITARDALGFTPLHWAAANDDICTLLNILHTVAETEFGSLPAIVDTRDRNGATALHAACANARAQAVGVLLRFDADLNARDAEGMTPLATLAVANEGLAFDCPTYSPHSAFGVSILWNILQAAELLLGKGADVERGDLRGRTPLGWAVVTGDVRFAEFLLANGANSSARDLDGLTPMEVAERQGAEMLEVFSRAQREELGDWLVADLERSGKGEAEEEDYCFV